MNTSLFTIFGCLFFVLLAPTLKAQTHSEKQDAYQHLFEVNKEWTHFKAAAPTQKNHFTSDTKRIRFHLEAVIDHLSQLERNDKTISAQKKRTQLLEELQAYAAREVFPQNIYHKNRQPYFVDHKGTHCAVGYLMKVSGAGDLAQQIREEHNYDYLADIKTEGVLDWAEEHGFSLEELAWIQPGYIASKPFEGVGKGTNGPVNKMVQLSDKLYLIGDFDLVDSLPCLNIGVYEMGQLSCLGNGIEGKINDITYEYNTQTIFVVGDLIDGGIHYPIASYEAATGWTFDSIPGRANAEGLHILGAYNMQIVIKDPAIAGTELWKNSAGTWQLNYTFHGSILNMESYWYVGLFDSVTFHQQGIPDTVFYSHNAIALDLNFNGYPIYTFNATDTLLPDTILAVKTSGFNTYFAGHSGNLFKPSLTRYLNNSLQPLLFEYDLCAYDFNEKPKIFDLELDPSSGDLYLVGDMKSAPFNGTGWTSLAKYKISTGFLEIYNKFDSSITSVAIFEGDLIIGGPFEAAGDSLWGTNQVLNHLAKLYVPTSVHTLKSGLAVKVFPNPTSSNLTIDLGNDYIDASIQISNALGQVIDQQEYLSTNSINLSLEGDAGLYLVKVKTAGSESIVKVIKY